MIEYGWENVECQLRGYGTKEQTALARVAKFNRRARRQRAWLALVTWWAVAASAIFIPLAHFVLVPGFAVYGVHSFFRRLQIEVEPVSADGTCPDCAEAQTFALPGRWADSMDVTCKKCRRTLRLTVQDADHDAMMA